ncbi:prolactin-8A9-like isoform X2 [Mastomys coucha]|uniref:prolactin-8A9-like isoform X2 n=1 Tax=Mastomys coucha TaxID=35658 RepID=UPI001261FF71|nr:prolactin-8A9-like isoform X2 [Mastomys coucha]
MLPLSQPYFRAFLLLVVSNLILWEKTSSVPACQTEGDVCSDPLVITFNNAIQRAEVIQILAEKLHEEFYNSPFSSRQFATLVSRMNRHDEEVVRARNYCHSNVTNPPHHGPEYESIKTKKYLKMMIDFMDSWVNPIFYMVEVLSGMQNVPESIFSKFQLIELKINEISKDLMWILQKVYPKTKWWDKVIFWEYLPGLRSTEKSKKFLAMFNISHCLRFDAFYMKFHLQTLMCRITGKEC